MPSGKIIKSLSGFYEVHTGSSVYRCRARGVFRALGVKPLVGDNVTFDVVDEDSDPKEGNVTGVLPRSNELIRPSVANVDQALLIFAIRHPMPSLNMLDRFLISMQERGIPAVLCFSKSDLALPEERHELRTVYENCGCHVIFLSNAAGEGLSEIRAALAGKTTVLAGPSGVGKSTLINELCPGASAETGELSRKIGRGKNTTRHVELFRVEEFTESTGQLETASDEAGCNKEFTARAGKEAGDRMTFVVDTPGFTALDLTLESAEKLKDYYPEFDAYKAGCRFDGCNHMEEPGCAVRQAVQDGEIPRIRYENYRVLFQDLKNRRPVYR